MELKFIRCQVICSRYDIYHTYFQFTLVITECDSDEDEEYKEQVKQLKEAVPFAVCGATTLLEVKGRKVRGRLYPWGVVEVENPEHCDFIKLRTMLM